MASEKVKKVNRLINKYYSLTPLGLGLIGQEIIEQIDQECEGHPDLRKAVTKVMEIRSGGKRPQ